MSKTDRLHDKTIVNILTACGSHVDFPVLYGQFATRLGLDNRQHSISTLVHRAVLRLTADNLVVGEWYDEAGWRTYGYRLTNVIERLSDVP